MPQASNNQMWFLQRHGIGLPKTHERWGVRWQPKRWSEQHVCAIISFIQEGNGGKGTETTPDERIALYQQAREKYEGKVVVRKWSRDKKRCLVLVVVPETREHLLWVAKQKGVDPSKVSLFCCNIVAEDEPPDHHGHILGPANLDRYRVVGEPTAATSSEGPKHIPFDHAAFGPQTQQMLYMTLRAFTEQEGFCDGDILPSPEDVAVYQERPFRQMGEQAVYQPLSTAEVAEVYQKSYYVRPEGTAYIVVAKIKVVSVA